MAADDVIRKLELKPHPEGGFYRETWRDEPKDGERGHGTSIYFLLRGSERNRNHRVDAVEVFHYYAGDPVELCLREQRQAEPRRLILGPDVLAGQQPQVVIPAGMWQSARCLGERYTLIGCTVSPAFQFEGFELDPDDNPAA